MISERVRNFFQKNKKIIAISLSATIVSGFSFFSNINKKQRDSDTIGNEHSIVYDYSTSENSTVESSVGVIDNLEGKTDYFNDFNLQMDGNKIIDISDKNGVSLTKYVKNCSITKVEDSKIYLDNDYIIFYDNYGFKYICKNHYKEYSDYNCENNTGKFTFGYDEIVYYDRSTNSLINTNSFSEMFELSLLDEIKIIKEIAEDKHLMNLYKQAYPEDEDFSNFYVNFKSIQKRSIRIIYNFFKLYEGKENEFEKIFGFPMYIMNKDGLKVYNIYKFKFLEKLYIQFRGDSFYTCLLNEYNIKIKPENISNSTSISNNKSSYLELINSLKDLKKRYGQIFISLHIEKKVKDYNKKTGKFYDSHTLVYGFCDFYIEEVLEDGGIEVSDYLGRRYVIGYKDLLLTDEDLSYNIEINTLYANNIQLNLFNEDNINSNQYGGNQGLFEQDAHFLLNDPYIKKQFRNLFSK